MHRTPRQYDPFSEKWKQAGAAAQRTVADKPAPASGKPVARRMWERAVRQDPAFQMDSANFNTQAAFAAWLQGWMDSEIQHRCPPKSGQMSKGFFTQKGFRSEQEIAALRDKLAKLIEFSPVAKDMLLFDQVHDDPRFIFACHVGDVLDWVLGKTSTEEFLSDTYLDMEHLEHILKR